jgi:hypothetical protein
MIWTSTQKKDTKIVAVKDQVIYLFNPKETEIDNYVSDLKMKRIPQKNVMSIPFRYINVINFYEHKNKIEILFGSSTEEFIVSDPAKRVEIFTYLMQNIPGIQYSVVPVSGLEAGKKPMIALFVVLGLFIWSYYYASSSEMGIDYHVVGNQLSLTNLILILAGLGTKGLIVLFGCLLTIAGIALYKKMKNPFVVRRLWK